MKSLAISVEVITLVILALIPWPGSVIFNTSCPRDGAAIVRKVFQKKWMPVLERYKVSLPLDCPFHPSRDIFQPQQEAKHKHRPSLWTCGFCGKSFYSEAYLELHFDSRHHDEVNTAEDAVCLADFCDIMRCEVVEARGISLTDSDSDVTRTDLEVWHEATAYRTALTLTGSREVARVQIPKRPGKILEAGTKDSSSSRLLCKKKPKEDAKEADSNSSTTETCTKNISEAQSQSDRRLHRLAELKNLKANCKPEYLKLVREKCELLVQECVLGLLLNLTEVELQEIEEELHRAICWYLTCDRYWEDALADIRSFPWGLVFVLIMLLSLGVCLVYYLIWVLFDTDDSTSSKSKSFDSKTSEDIDDQYIYVTYPPDLKRRLLESCYNRTTRL